MLSLPTNQSVVMCFNACKHNFRIEMELCVFAFSTSSAKHKSLASAFAASNGERSDINANVFTV